MTEDEIMIGKKDVHVNYNLIAICLVIAVVVGCCTLVWLYYHPIHFEFTPETMKKLETCANACAQKGGFIK